MRWKNEGDYPTAAKNCQCFSSSSSHTYQVSCRDQAWQRKHWVCSHAFPHSGQTPASGVGRATAQRSSPVCEQQPDITSSLHPASAPLPAARMRRRVRTHLSLVDKPDRTQGLTSSAKVTPRRYGRQAANAAAAPTTEMPAIAKTIGRMQQKLAAMAATMDAPRKLLDFMTVPFQLDGNNACRSGRGASLLATITTGAASCAKASHLSKAGA